MHDLRCFHYDGTMVALTILMMRILPTLALVGLFLNAVPAFAAPAAAEVPEPSDLALFGLGLLGVVLGYRAVRVQKKRDAEPTPKSKPIE